MNRQPVNVAVVKLPCNVMPENVAEVFVLTPLGLLFGFVKTASVSSNVVAVDVSSAPIRNSP